MKAKIKNIELHTSVNDGGHIDNFVKHMVLRIGEIIEVMEKPGCERWYEESNICGFNFHESWLEFVE